MHVRIIHAACAARTTNSWWCTSASAAPSSVSARHGRRRSSSRDEDDDAMARAKHVAAALLLVVFACCWWLSSQGFRVCDERLRHGARTEYIASVGFASCRSRRGRGGVVGRLGLEPFEFQHGGNIITSWRLLRFVRVTAACGSELTDRSCHRAARGIVGSFKLCRWFGAPTGLPTLAPRFSQNGAVPPLHASLQPDNNNAWGFTL